MMLTASSLESRRERTVIVEHSPHTAGVWRRSGKRQSHWGKCAHEQQNKQQSGGQTVHGWLCVF